MFIKRGSTKPDPHFTFEAPLVRTHVGDQKTPYGQKNIAKMLAIVLSLDSFTRAHKTHAKMLVNALWS